MDELDVTYQFLSLSKLYYGTPFQKIFQYLYQNLLKFTQALGIFDNFVNYHNLGVQLINVDS